MNRDLVDLIRAATALQVAALAYYANGEVSEIEAMHKCLSQASAALRFVQTKHHAQG